MNTADHVQLIDRIVMRTCRDVDLCRGAPEDVVSLLGVIGEQAPAKSDLQRRALRGAHLINAKSAFWWDEPCVLQAPAPPAAIPDLAGD